MKISAEPISLSYGVNPADVCGGVWVDDREVFVPVALLPDSEYHDDAFGHTLWEYAEVDLETGEPISGPGSEPLVRASLLHVPTGGESPAWHILPSAAEPGYYERTSAVEGQGDFFHWVPLTEFTPCLRIRHALPNSPSDKIEVRPGDVFQVRAANVGAHVLSTFSGAPFRIAYEERVDPPRNMLLP